MGRPSINLSGLITQLFVKRQLLMQLIVRDISARYRGSALGIVWSFINPLIMLVIYTFVFAIVFKARWSQVGVSTDAEQSQLEFALILFAGLIVFNFFSEAILRSTTVLLQNPNYVKKVVFPLELLPFMVLGSAAFHSLVSLLVLILFQLIFQHYLVWTVVFFPLIALSFGFFTLGIAYFLSSLSVFFRDVGQMIGSLILILMFVTPIFYPVSAIPEKYRLIIKLNPLEYWVSTSREVLIFGQIPSLGMMAAYTFGSILVLFLGYAWFQKTRHMFADVL